MTQTILCAGSPPVGGYENYHRREGTQHQYVIQAKQHGQSRMKDHREDSPHCEERLRRKQPAKDLAQPLIGKLIKK